MKDGYILKNKSASVLSNEELSLINNLTRRKFTQEEIYVFSVVLCDNDVDRENERFTDDALKKLSELYVGKTGILDHNPTSENQTARIFKCWVEEVSGKKNSLGNPYKRLLAKAYMPRSSKNEDIILEIDSGIKKEVSVGCSVENITCSICGRNMKSDLCSHIKGKKYKKDGSYTLCYAVLDNPVDAYEWSFVAVPAQREAGVIKSYKISTPKGGENSMEDVIKALSTGQSVNFSESQATKLFDIIQTLTSQAEIGKSYVEELKNDVVKLSAMVQPEISTELMKDISAKLSIKELKSLRDSFKSKLSKIVPISPQFAPEKSENSKNQNLQFKI